MIWNYSCGNKQPKDAQMGYKHLQLIIHFPQILLFSGKTHKQNIETFAPSALLILPSFFNPQPPVVLNQNIVRRLFRSYISVYAFFAVCSKLIAAREIAFINGRLFT